MAAGERQAISAPDRRSSGGRALVLLLIIFVLAMAGLAISPLILGVIFAGGQDYAVLGDLGQAYGAASAMVAGLALFVVIASVFVQYRHMKAMQIQAFSEANEELVLLAMDNPAYRQCWGARIAPEGIEEDLFYFCAKVVRGWTRAWELGIIDEPQAREYLKNFFDSEIPRTYWASHGDWHRRGRSRDRLIRFREMINEEYLIALHGGPPSRAREDFRLNGDHFAEMNRKDPRSRRAPKVDLAE
jgi:hypothetical protein